MTPPTVSVAAVVRTLRKSLREWNGVRVRSVKKRIPVNPAHLDGVLYGIAVSIDEVRKLAARAAKTKGKVASGRKKG